MPKMVYFDAEYQQLNEATSEAEKERIAKLILDKWYKGCVDMSVKTFEEKKALIDKLCSILREKNITCGIELGAKDSTKIHIVLQSGYPVSLAERIGKLARTKVDICEGDLYFSVSSQLSEYSVYTFGIGRLILL